MTQTLEQIAAQTAHTGLDLVYRHVGSPAQVEAALSSIILTALQTATAQHAPDNRIGTLEATLEIIREKVSTDEDFDAEAIMGLVDVVLGQDPDTFGVLFNGDEHRAILELANSKELSPRKVITQALRLYQYEDAKLRNPRLGESKLSCAQHAPTQKGDWAEANLAAFNQWRKEAEAVNMFSPEEAWGAGIEFARRHAPQPDLASVREAVKRALDKILSDSSTIKLTDCITLDQATDRILRALTPLLGANEDRERLDALMEMHCIVTPNFAKTVRDNHDLLLDRDEVDDARHSAPKEGGAAQRQQTGRKGED